MTNTFRNAKAFNGDLSQWDVSNVTSMEEMFRGAIAFNSDISRWDVGSLSRMYRMFFAARAFDRSLGYWNITQVNEMIQALPSMSTLNYDRTLIGWSKQEVRSGVILEGGRRFCASEEARAYLINEKDWEITDGGTECPEVGEANILYFEFAEQTDRAYLDFENHTISVEVATGLTALKPTMVLSKGATCSPSNEETLDFTEPVTYTVRGSGGVTTQDWVVTVTTVEIPLSVDRIEGRINVYPNPSSSGHYNLQLPAGVSANDIEMTMYDFTGQKTQFSTITDGKYVSIRINEPNGAYLLYLKSNHKVEVLKLLKE